MKSLTFTDFRRQASGFISEVERGETLIILRRGKPVAEIIPFSDNAEPPMWQKPGIRLHIPGSELSHAILAERENGQ